MKIRVAIVEDDLELSTEMKRLLDESEDVECVGVFGDGESALKELPKTKADVVLMDIHLPGMNGIECLAALKPKHKEIEFLMCTSFEDSETVFKALKVGASGYLVKTAKASVLLDAINEVMRGGAPMSSQIARKIVQSFQPVEQKNGQEKLSKREMEIAELLSKGYRYKQIADELFVSTDTVRTHIYNIYQKLQVNSKMEAINKLFR